MVPKAFRYESCNIFVDCSCTVVCESGSMGKGNNWLHFPSFCPRQYIVFQAAIKQSKYTCSPYHLAEPGNLWGSGLSHKYPWVSLVCFMPANILYSSFQAFWVLFVFSSSVSSSSGNKPQHLHCIILVYDIQLNALIFEFKSAIAQ